MDGVGDHEEDGGEVDEYDNVAGGDGVAAGVVAHVDRTVPVHGDAKQWQTGDVDTCSLQSDDN